MNGIRVYLRLRRNVYVLILEAALIFLAVVLISNEIDFYISSIDVDPNPEIVSVNSGLEIRAVLMWAFTVFLAPFLAGFWVGIWQIEKDEYASALAGCFGLILVNIFSFIQARISYHTRMEYPYIFLISIGLIAAWGGLVGYKSRLHRRLQSSMLVR